MKTTFINSRFLTVLIFLFSCMLFSRAQDPLEEQLQTTQGEDRMKILFKLGKNYLTANPQKSITFSKEALIIAEQLDDANVKIQSSLYIAQASELTKDFQGALSYYEKTLSMLEKTGDRQITSYLYERIGKVSFQLNQYLKAETNLKKALALYSLINDHRGKTVALGFLGDMYSSQHKFEEAVNYFKQALQEADADNNDRERVNSLLRLGGAYSDWGNYDEAYNYYQKALGIAQAKNLTDLLPAINKNIEITSNNKQIRSENKTQYEAQQEQKEQEHMKEMEEKSEEYELQSVKSLEEIGKLKAADQLKELKLRVQQDDFNQKMMVKKAQLLKSQQEAEMKNMEAERKQKQIELLKKEKALKDAEIERQKMLNYQVMGGLIGIGLITLLIITALWQKHRANKTLHQKNKVISEQKEQIEKKNETIISSIEYAKRIQDVILVSEEKFKSFFPDSFILYKPRDIVSGDFYYITHMSPPLYGAKPQLSEVLLACCDCTGHGVPGAFMSLLGVNMLREAIRKNTSGTSAEIINTLNDLVCGMMLNQEEGDVSKYGMDAAIVLIKFTPPAGGMLQFSGAHNPLYLIRSGQLREIKADKATVGTRRKEGKALFANYELPFQNGDQLYIFSDGYADQMGGPEKRKYYKETFRNLLQSMASLPMSQQRDRIEEEHLKWKKDYPQTDDILVMGARL